MDEFRLGVDPTVMSKADNYVLLVTQLRSAGNLSQPESLDDRR
jgi:hypothetical protein